MNKKPFKPNLFFVAAILSVLGLAYYARKNSQSDITLHIDPATQQTVATNSSRGPAGEAALAPTEDVGISSDLNSEEQVRQWVHQEARTLDRSKTDTRDHEDRIEKEIASYGDVQLQQLKLMVKDKKLPMNERVLSAYMLGKSTASNSYLVEIASQTSENKKHAPHSEGEIRNSQDRALKIMSVDAIVKSAAPVNNKLEDLQNIIKASNDPLIQDYAKKHVEDLRKKL